MATGLPTTINWGNPPYSNPVFESEAMRNVLYGLGDVNTGPVSGIRGFLEGLNLYVFNMINQMSYGAGSLGPTGSTAAPYSRFLANVATQANQNAKLQLVAVWLPQNFVVNNFNFLVGTTGDAAPTNQWMCLLNASRVAVAVSADALTTAITASTTTAPVTVSYPVATVAAGAGTTYVTPTAGLYYIGLAVNGSSTLLTGGFTSILEAVNIVPILAGNSTTSTSTPIAVGGAAQTAITGVAAVPFLFLS